MVTGLANLRRGPSQFQPGQSVIYVAEINSGILAAYGVRWNVGRSLSVPRCKHGLYRGSMPLETWPFGRSNFSGLWPAVIRSGRAKIGLEPTGKVRLCISFIDFSFRDW